MQPVFAAYWLIASATEPGYAPLRQYISELGAPRAAAPVLLDVMLVVWGTSIVLAGWALREVAPRRAGIAGLLLIVSGIAVGLAGPVHLECWASIHPGCAGAHAALQRGHNALAWISQVALAFSAVMLAWGLRDQILRAMLAGASAVVLLYVGGWVGPAGGHDRHAGLAQRLGIGSAQVWVLVMAVGVLIATSRRVSGASRG